MQLRLHTSLAPHIMHKQDERCEAVTGLAKC